MFTKVLVVEQGCWFWQRSKQAMHFTPMRASVSTIGPPYGTEAPPPSSTPAEGLIHAFRQRFTASLPALGSTVPARSGPTPLSWQRDSHHLTYTKPHLAGPALKPSWGSGDRSARLFFVWVFYFSFFFSFLTPGQWSQLVSEYLSYCPTRLSRSASGFYFLGTLWKIEFSKLSQRKARVL